MNYLAVYAKLAERKGPRCQVEASENVAMTQYNTATKEVSASRLQGTAQHA